MTESLTRDSADTLWAAPEWYRGLPLSERWPVRDAAPGSPVSQADVSRGTPARLRAWKGQKPFDQEALFTARLATSALSEEDLAALLEEAASDLKARAAADPDWLLALGDAFATKASDAVDALGGSLDGLAGGHPLAECLPALAPLLAWGLASLRREAEALRGRHGFLPLAPGVLEQAFLSDLAPALLFQVSKPVVLEMHIARLQGRLRGESPNERFLDFTRRLREEDGFTALLRKYPVLGRQIVVAVEQWRDFLGEVLAHLCEDWAAICATFADGGDPGLLLGLDGGNGDRHRRGRSVLILRFDSELQLVYKPKTLAVDLHFQDLVRWLNDQGQQPPLRPLELLDRGEYGWCEFVGTAPCQSREAVARFYERQGSCLALLYALDATDLHNENLIAAGEHPMLVDLEALFHPHVYGQDPLLTANLAAAALDDSVWQVGLLPRRVWADEDSVGVDTSGLGGEGGQINPHPIVGFSEAGGDEMRVGRRRVELPMSENRPRLGEAEVDVLDYRDAVLGGFTRTYRLLCRHRETLLSEWLPRFAEDEVRVVMRSTNIYGLLLYESFHPDVLRDALDRDRLFDRLWAEAAQRPYLARILAAEQRDLWQGDIPVFSTTPASRTVFTSEGEPLADLLDAPSLALVEERVKRLGEEDLAKQIWIIEASLATLAMEREGGIPRPLQRPESVRPVTRDRLREMAAEVGDRLEDLALQNDRGAYWLGIVPLDDFHWGLVPSGVDLYAGTAGLALFLGYLGAATGNPSHTRLAQRAASSVTTHLEAVHQTRMQAGDELPFQPIGAFEGLGSVIYALTHLGVLWQARDLLDAAEQIVGTLPPLIPRDTHLDVIYGSAGCILALLALDSVRPSASTLAVAMQCGERLLETAQDEPRGKAWTTLADQPPLAGLSHGGAGVALSLLRLAARSGEDRFRSAALDALEFERTRFLPDLGNWADLRVFPVRQPPPEHPDQALEEPEVQNMIAWCHGAPGIGLARLAALDQLDDAVIRSEIDAAIAATTAFGFDINHSLCHGALGNVELLLSAAQLLGRPQDHEALEQATAHVAASIETNGPLTGVPLGVETPGLMSGLAGIGYELLRLAEPERVPSILTLAPPCHTAWD